MPDVTNYWPPRETIKRLACVTMVRDEDFFLEVFVNHYTRMYSDVDFFIIDHASINPVSEFARSRLKHIPQGRINVIRIPPIPFDDNYKSSAISSLANMALAAYDVVIVSDIDEIVIPIGGDIVEIAMADRSEIIAPLGFEAIHHTKVEKSYEPDHPFLSQRRYGYFRAAESKPVIWKAHNTASPGLHKSVNKFDFNERLILAHLRYVDFRKSRDRIEHRQSINFSKNQKHHGYGAYWSASTEAREEIFKKAASSHFVSAQTLIPEFIKSMRDSISLQPQGYHGPDLSISSPFCELNYFI